MRAYSPCPPSALPGRRGNGAPIPPAFRRRHSGGGEQGEPGPGCWEAARRPSGAKGKTRGQATAVTVPPVPRGGVRLSRGARRAAPGRAVQAICELRMNKPNVSLSIVLRIARQGPHWWPPRGEGRRDRSPQVARAHERQWGHGSLDGAYAPGPCSRGSRWETRPEFKGVEAVHDGPDRVMVRITWFTAIRGGAPVQGWPDSWSMSGLIRSHPA